MDFPSLDWVILPWGFSCSSEQKQHKLYEQVSYSNIATYGWQPILSNFSVRLYPVVLYIFILAVQPFGLIFGPMFVHGFSKWLINFVNFDVFIDWRLTWLSSLENFCDLSVIYIRNLKMTSVGFLSVHWCGRRRIMMFDNLLVFM